MADNLQVKIFPQQKQHFLKKGYKPATIKVQSDE
jgi:hypothetical protein